MKIVADLHGLNEQYRRARDTHRPFKFDKRAWAKVLKERRTGQGKNKHPWAQEWQNSQDDEVQE
ncbi:MAG: hypothetical protein V2A79_10215 [Planctomycetota bacterium]